MLKCMDSQWQGTHEDLEVVFPLEHDILTTDQIQIHHSIRD